MEDFCRLINLLWSVTCFKTLQVAQLLFSYIALYSVAQSKTLFLHCFLGSNISTPEGTGWRRPFWRRVLSCPHFATLCPSTLRPQTPSSRRLLPPNMLKVLQFSCLKGVWRKLFTEWTRRGSQLNTAFSLFSVFKMCDFQLFTLF